MMNIQQRLCRPASHAALDGPSFSGRTAPTLSSVRRSVGAQAGNNGGKGMSPEKLQVNYDPDNLLGAAKTGHIARRMLEKTMQKDAKAYAVVIKKAEDDRIEELESRRGGRTPPTQDYKLIDFLLDTPADDIEYEVARCRPLLTPEFFKYLNTVVGTEKFAVKPDTEKLAELEMLRTYLEQGVKAVDAAVAATSSSVERMKKLLSAPDKKQCILDMAAANEIDLGLIDLLRENASAARDANQEQAAIFMEKVAVAAAKFLV